MSTFYLGFLCLTLYFCHAFGSVCQVTLYRDTNITCTDISGTKPSLDELTGQLRNTLLANTTKAVEIKGDGNVISENLLVPFPNVESLDLRGGMNKTTIHPRAFARLTNLRRLSITFIDLDKDKVDELFRPLANTLEELYMFVVRNVERMDVLKTFTKLQKISFEMVELNELPRLQNSSNTLRSVQIGRANLGNVSADTFRGLSNLERLDLGESGVTSVEKGAFDDLLSLKNLYLTCNYGLTGMTPDMFRPMPKLRVLHLMGTKVNITRESLGFLSKDLEFETGNAIC